MGTNADYVNICHDEFCNSCGKRKPEVVMIGYSTDTSQIELCRHCALQLARKLLEDLCDLDGDRYG